MDTSKFIPIKRRIVVRKCTTGEKKADGYYLGGIAIPDYSADACWWAEIIDVSADCKLFEKAHIGSFVFLPAWKPGMMNNIDGQDDFVIREKLFELPPNKGGCHPMIYTEGP